MQPFTASESFKNGDEIENDKMDGHDLNILEFASVLAATNNFSSENKLGEGGFGPIYKVKCEISFDKSGSNYTYFFVENVQDSIVFSIKRCLVALILTESTFI